jgi:hypothetical protein
VGEFLADAASSGAPGLEAEHLKEALLNLTQGVVPASATDGLVLPKQALSNVGRAIGIMCLPQPALVATTVQQLLQGIKVGRCCVVAFFATWQVLP